MQPSPGKLSLCAALGLLAADAGSAHAAGFESVATAAGGSGLLTAIVLVAGSLALLWFYCDERRRLRFDAVIQSATGITTTPGRHEQTMELELELDGAIAVPPPLPPPPPAEAEREIETLDLEPELATTVDPSPARHTPPPPVPLPRRQPARPLPRISERLGAGPAPQRRPLPQRPSAGALA